MRQMRSLIKYISNPRNNGITFNLYDIDQYNITSVIDVLSFYSEGSNFFALSDQPVIEVSNMLYVDQIQLSLTLMNFFLFSINAMVG